jgi:hypothetical protein
MNYGAVAQDSARFANIFMVISIASGLLSGGYFLLGAGVFG